MRFAAATKFARFRRSAENFRQRAFDDAFAFLNSVFHRCAFARRLSGLIVPRCKTDSKIHRALLL